MNKNYPDARSVYKTTKIIYYAIIIGLLLFAAVIFYISSTDFFLKIDFSDTLLVPALMFICAAIPFGLFVAKSAINKIQAHEGLKEKLQKYQVILIIKIASCEGAGLFAGVCFLVTSNLVYLILMAIVLAVMLTYYPSEIKIASEINLTQNEVFELEKY